MFFILISTLCLIIILNWVSKKWVIYSALSKIQGPPGIPIIGSTKEVVFLNPVTLFNKGREWASTFKDVYKLWFFPYGIINIYNPDDLEIILSNSKHNEKSMIYSFLQPWLQEGLLVSEGQKWFHRRKILTPAFHFNILRHFSSIFEDNSRRLVELLHKETEESRTDVVPLVSSFALNSICETAMGTKLDEENVSERGEEYKKAIHKIGFLTLYRSLRVWLYPDWIFNLTSTGREQKKILETIRKFPDNVINERREFIEKNPDIWDKAYNNKDDDVFKKSKRRLAMLDLLISAEKDGLIDEKGIKEEVDTFMFEGHDTTSMGLVYTLMLLANHKEIQDKVVAEARNILGESNREATMTDLLEMRYLDCCIKESLRLYPPVHFISRHINEPVQLKTCQIPANVMCHIHIIDLHRRADLYPDPLRYDPDRFRQENSVKRHPYAYIPFSAGSRNCIGQKFAILEMKTVLTAILRNYELRPISTPDDVILSTNLILRPNNPVYVKFMRRDNAF